MIAMRAILILIFCLFLPLAIVADDRPNILLVMADDQGWGDAGFMGHPFVQTPGMDEMAKNSVVFNRFHASAPVCSPTRASVLTGRHPFRTNVPNHGHYMRPNEVPIAEVLRDSGYVTGHFGKWHIGSVQPDSPTNPGGAGFDEWYSGLNFFDIDPYLSRNGVYENPKGQGSAISMDATIEFLEKHKDGDKPMFAVTWFPAPHGPFAEVPVDFPGGDDLYADKKGKGYFLEITLIDQQIARLRKSLRKMGIEDNTILWYTSDNGGLMEESSGGRQKKGSIYQGGLLVPSILEWPAKWEPREINMPAFSSDIYPTLLAVTGAEVEHQPKLDGIDLVPVIEGKVMKRPPMAFWHGHTAGQSTHSDRIIKALMEAQQAGEPSPFPERVLKNVEEYPSFSRRNPPGHAAWIEWPWKLHSIATGKDSFRLELYNLAKDPMEEKNLWHEEEARTKELLQKLESWQHSVYESWEGRDYK